MLAMSCGTGRGPGPVERVAPARRVRGPGSYSAATAGRSAWASTLARGPCGWGRRRQRERVRERKVVSGTGGAAGRCAAGPAVRPRQRERRHAHPSAAAGTAAPRHRGARRAARSAGARPRRAPPRAPGTCVTSHPWPYRAASAARGSPACARPPPRPASRRRCPCRNAGRARGPERRRPGRAAALQQLERALLGPEALDPLHEVVVDLQPRQREPAPRAVLDAALLDRAHQPMAGDAVEPREGLAASGR